MIVSSTSYFFYIFFLLITLYDTLSKYQNFCLNFNLFLGAKKHSKKENRKSPAYIVDTLGPALFSTPDIIRRVGTNGDPKVQENVVTSLLSTTPPAVVSSGNSLTQATQSSLSSSTPTSSATSNRSGLYRIRACTKKLLHV